jgi:hypothetical protein
LKQELPENEKLSALCFKLGILSSHLRRALAAAANPQPL